MDTNEGGTVKVTTALRNEQAAYYRLCDEARTLGIPTSLDDPRTSKTVDELRGAIARAKFDLGEPTEEDFAIAASACELLADLDDGAQVDIDRLREAAARIAGKYGSQFPAT